MTWNPGFREQASPYFFRRIGSSTLDIQALAFHYFDPTVLILIFRVTTLVTQHGEWLRMRALFDSGSGEAASEGAKRRLGW